MQNIYSVDSDFSFQKINKLALLLLVNFFYVCLILINTGYTDKIEFLD